MASHSILTPVQSLSKKPCCVFNRWKKTLRPIYMISRGQWHPRQNMKHLYSATAARHGSQIIETGQQRHPFSSRYWLNNRRSINCRVTAWFLISRAQIIIAKQRKSFIPVSVWTQLHIRQWSGNCPCFSHFGNGSRSPHQHSQPAICELRFNVCS